MTIHVYPVDDLVAHPMTAECICGPTTEPVRCDDGGMAWVVVHHSLDGREAQEVTDEEGAA